MKLQKFAKTIAAGMILSAATFATTGCDRTEEVLDVETPAGDVEVEENVDTGETSVDIDEN